MMVRSIDTKNWATMSPPIKQKRGNPVTKPGCSGVGTWGSPSANTLWTVSSSISPGKSVGIDGHLSISMPCSSCSRVSLMLLDGRTSVEVCCSEDDHCSKSRPSSSGVCAPPGIAAGEAIVEVYCACK